MKLLACVLLLVAFVTVGCASAPAAYTVNFQCLSTDLETATVHTVSVVATSPNVALYMAAQPVQVVCQSTFAEDYRFGAVSRGEDVPQATASR